MLLTAHLFLVFQADTVPRYLPSQFECAVFRETVISDVRGEAGRAVRLERLGRSGVLITRWPADSTHLSIWFDSLHVWREDSTGRIEPDTEGILGGRWIGRLDSQGTWTAEQVPFVPDEVAMVQDLRPLGGDFFPLLPARPLRVGAADTSLGRAIRRERDQGSDRRYSWTLEHQVDTVAALDDSLEVMVRREVREEGMMLWRQDRGPLGWERTISTTVSPPGGSTKARGVVAQTISVIRLEDRSRCGGTEG